MRAPWILGPMIQRGPHPTANLQVPRRIFNTKYLRIKYTYRSIRMEHQLDTHASDDNKESAVCGDRILIRHEQGRVEHNT
jgi:hypothetical protein